jgi:hypothetical protein
MFYKVQIIRLCSGGIIICHSTAFDRSDLDNLYLDQGVLAPADWTKYIHRTEDLSAMVTAHLLSACKIKVSLHTL